MATIARAIENAMKKLNMSKKDACRLMDVTSEEYDSYKKTINRKQME